MNAVALRLERRIELHQTQGISLAKPALLTVGNCSVSR
jgi:hypothetical protein